MRRWRWALVPAAGGLASLLAAGSALACGGLIGPNGGVQLEHTTTLVGYHDGLEQYITAFTFSGGTGNFGSLTPLPAIPTTIERGGAWTLQRLERETNPPVPEAFNAVEASAAGAEAPAQVIETATVGALDLTVLKGGGDAVGEWAKAAGFSLPPDAPATLDFYANRSPIFLAAKFNASAAAAQGQASGSITPIHLTIPTSAPWLPIRILTLGKQASEFVQADAYLLTDRAPAMLPAPVVLGSDLTSANGLTLAASEPASAGLITDLKEDQGNGWIPSTPMWLTYLKINAPAENLSYDLAIDPSGANHPSPVAAGLDSVTTNGGHAAGPLVPATPAATTDGWLPWLVGLGAAMVVAWWGATLWVLRGRRMAVPKHDR